MKTTTKYNSFIACMASTIAVLLFSACDKKEIDLDGIDRENPNLTIEEYLDNETIEGLTKSDTSSLQYVITQEGNGTFATDSNMVSYDISLIDLNKELILAVEGSKVPLDADSPLPLALKEGLFLTSLDGNTTLYANYEIAYPDGIYGLVHEGEDLIERIPRGSAPGLHGFSS